MTAAGDAMLCRKIEKRFRYAKICLLFAIAATCPADFRRDSHPRCARNLGKRPSLNVEQIEDSAPHRIVGIRRVG